ncbi:hypothetical protein [Pseudomonas syringae]|uniref:hypothetical protein n=1 Tax=Pseudomonas syringae TaxID=317 RepID=UPI00245F5727|nr:hypothetical protein [Pseudomonas syringae]MDH4602362.1 hypothetical protein [Pseudomonas syringae pv. papulans]
MASSFPWAAHGLTFRSRSQLERTIEQLAAGPTKRHSLAATRLLNDARRAKILSEDEAEQIRLRLHM